MCLGCTVDEVNRKIGIKFGDPIIKQEFTSIHKFENDDFYIMYAYEAINYIENKAYYMGEEFSSDRLSNTLFKIISFNRFEDMFEYKMKIDCMYKMIFNVIDIHNKERELEVFCLKNTKKTYIILDENINDKHVKKLCEVEMCTTIKRS